MRAEAESGEELGYVIIRQYQPQDYGKLVSLMHESYPGYRPSGFLSEEYLVAENQKRIVGAIFCWKLPRYIELADLVVRREFRRQGIAAALVQAAEELATENYRADIRLNDPIEDEKMIAFYESLGFVKVRQTQKGAIMVKQIGNHEQNS